MVELYQAEWCPFSRQVRERLTELQVDFVARQVAAQRPDRTAMQEATGHVEIPTIVFEDGTVLSDAAAIVEALDERYPETDQTAAHVAQAAAH